MHDRPRIGWIGQLQESAPRFLRPVEFRLARTIDELKAASHLVYREYLRRNYLKPQASQLKLSFYQALPTTATFVAVHRHAGIVAALTLIEDSPCGLPMDEIYKAELDGLRRAKLHLAELGMLALDGELFRRGTFTMFHAKKLLLTLRLFKAMFDYVRTYTSIDELVACFNPKHQILYDFLQLKALGDLKTYAGANGNPAVARHMNINETQRRAQSHVAYKFFFGRSSLSRPGKLVLSPSDLRELFAVQSDIFASASQTERTHLRHCYPTYNFDEIYRPVYSPSRESA